MILTKARKTLVVTGIFLSIFTCLAESRFFGSNQLSSSLITSTIQDKKGFIWVGTEYGLNRFDGIEMEEYLNNEDGSSLLDNSVRDIFCDNEGRIWVGMISGMQLYNDTTDDFTTVTFKGTTYTPNVSHILQLKTGQIWVIVSRLGIFEVNDETMTAYPVNRLTELCGIDHFNHIHEDSRQRLWIGTDEDGLFCIDKDLENVENFRLTRRNSEKIDRISENANGIIIVSCDGKIWIFDEVGHNFIELSQPDEIYLDTKEMLSRSNGDFLIASINHGLWRIDETNHCIRPEMISFPNELSREKSRIVSVMEDNENNLWLGCYQRGVVMIPYPTENKDFNFINLSRIENPDRRNDNGATSAICKDRLGRVWCGTQDGTVFLLTEKGDLIRKYKLNSAASCIFEDSRGEIWVGMNSFGLHNMNRNNGTTKSVPELTHIRVKTVIEGPGNTLYIGTLGNGIWTYDLITGKCTKFSTDDEENFKLLRNSYINRLMIDSQNRLWISHYLGASCFDLKSGRFLEISTNSTLNASVGYALIESKDSTVWIGTNNGLFSWNDKKGDYSQYTVTDGLTSNMICGLAEGADGNIWCSTFRGINHITPDGKEIISYNTSNGTSRQEYIQGIYCTDNDMIYFGDSYGLTYFSPPIKPTVKEREIVITSMYVGINKMSPTAYIHNNKLSFPYDHNTIRISVSTMAVKDAENIRFRYRLSGLDQEWYTTDYGEGRILFNTLPSGSYTLQICAEENSVISPVNEWEINIGKPWYRSITAYLIYIIVLTAIIILISFSIRRKRREEANERKLRYYVNMAHEIRSPMVMILNPIEKLLKKEDDPESRHALRTMKRNSLRIIRLMNYFLDIQKLDKGEMSLNCREVDLVETIKDLLDTFTYESNKRNITIDFEHPLDKMIFNVDPDNIDTIISNLVINAMKYTPDGGKVTIRLIMSEKYGNLELSVSDTGCGINEKEVEKVFRRFYQTSNKQYSGNRGFGIGLNLCQMLVELHNGTITVENRKDRSGSVFTVCIPTKIEINNKDKKTSESSTKLVTTIIGDTSEKARKEKKVRVKSTDKVLIIEDDEETRSYIEESLSNSYKVISAGDGDRGLQKILTELPDIVISDINLPGSTGLQIVKRVKNNPNTTHIPVILLTSRTGLDNKMEGLEHGADAYLVKPFNIDELQITIDNLLKNRQRVKGKYSGAYQEDKIKTIEVKGNSDVLMERIMKVINDNLDNPDLKVEMLAEEVGLSRAQLHRRIKEIAGISTGEFIRNIRLKKAAELLAEKKINISQVAYMVGFSSQTHFSTSFRKFYGISPTEYINR